MTDPDSPVDPVREGSPVVAAALVDWIEARLPRLVDDVCAAVCGRIELYRDEKIVPRADLRRSIAVNLRFMVDALAGTGVPDQNAPEDTGARRAHQGAPLPEVLRVYRVACGMLWDLLVRHARASESEDAMDELADIASLLWQVTDGHAVRVTEAYRATSAELLASQQRRRSALAEALFTGQRVFDAGPWEAGRLLGFSLDGKLAVVTAETLSLAQESLVGVERQLARLGIVSAWHLTPTQQAGVVSLREEQYDALLALLQDLARARTGISPLYRSLTDTPRALHLARAALAGIQPERREARAFSASPLAAFVAYDPDEGRRLADEVFGAVLDLSAEERDVLLETLDAYFSVGGSSERAAQVLHCHANTVRYRLRRIRELTDRSLTEPRQVAELVAALQALSLSSPRHSDAVLLDER
ncbi:PucR family transcriptional regulator [Amycolatopsis roodepoortensis]|uniref:DNA-binding PucR family transcriptional regulator n=1 Tax=Amycolatopsis roodepoortensis TaxID=700274 RepID=A0ABR9LBM0_9PSEU|nr:helix-turn-helix domain-containing protein [Amycolatopsis roodepoortensis]MBE1577722.1 DNA-binding PucR family transcriptional regulator [Amycolatopsis roodepoortensis]